MKRATKRAGRRAKVKKLEKKFFDAVNDAYWKGRPVLGTKVMRLHHQLMREVKRSGVQR